MSKFPGMRLYNNATEARATMLRLARDETAASIGTLIEIRDDMRLPASCRASAAIYLLDRAWGRPHTAVAVFEGENIPQEMDPREKALRDNLMKILDSGMLLPKIIDNDETPR